MYGDVLPNVVPPCRYMNSIHIPRLLFQAWFLATYGVLLRSSMRYAMLFLFYFLFILYFQLCLGGPKGTLKRRLERAEEKGASTAAS